MTAPSEPGEDQVTVADALAEPCPTCGAVPGALCVYMADTSRLEWSHGRPSRVLTHLRGETLAAKVHGDRRALVRSKRLRARRAAFLREHEGARKRRSEAAAAFRAMQAWDVAEYHALRAWWAKHGYLLANANRLRPDGTVRGEPYGWGQD